MSKASTAAAGTSKESPPVSGRTLSLGIVSSMTPSGGSCRSVVVPRSRARGRAVVVVPSVVVPQRVPSVVVPSVVVPSVVVPSVVVPSWSCRVVGRSHRGRLPVVVPVVVVPAVVAVVVPVVAPHGPRVSPCSWRWVISCVLVNLIVSSVVADGDLPLVRRPSWWYRPSVVPWWSP